MEIPEHYPGPDKVKAILAHARIIGHDISGIAWIDNYTSNSVEYQRTHYFQLVVVLGYFDSIIGMER
jgi:hypothetical protein